MKNKKKLIVVLPAFNAEKTLTQTYQNLPLDLIDELVLTDDCSSDNTINLAKQLGIKHILTHPKNRGYGGNQKSCYNKALELGADYVIMLHPDYQYEPKLIPVIYNMLTTNIYDIVLASRILGKGAIKGGMPYYKYIINRLLTFGQNILLNQKLSEYHTGYRGFSANVLRQIDFHKNSDDFIFDNQILVQCINENFSIGEISCPTKYFKEASSIGFKKGIKYALGIIKVSILFRLHKWKLYHYSLFTKKAN